VRYLLNARGNRVIFFVVQAGFLARSLASFLIPESSLRFPLCLNDLTLQRICRLRILMQVIIQLRFFIKSVNVRTVGRVACLPELFGRFVVQKYHHAAGNPH
jgi:hypothetical protein